MNTAPTLRSTRQQLDALATSLRSLDGARRGLPQIVGVESAALEGAAALAPLATVDFEAVALTPLGAFNVAREVLAEVAPVEQNPNLSPTGKRAAVLPILAKHRARAERLRERIDRGREALAEVRGRRRTPAAPDVVAAIRAREIREHLAQLSTAEGFEVVRNALDAIEADGAAARDARETLLSVLDAPAVIRARFSLSPDIVSTIEAALDPQHASTIEALAWAIERAEHAIGVLDEWLRGHESAAGAPRFTRLTGDPAETVERAREAVRRAIGPDGLSVA